MTSPDTGPSFRLAYVPGVTPTKWVRTWHERLPEVPLLLDQVPDADAGNAVRTGHADAALVRLPVDRRGLSAIPLYTETTVLVVPKDHLLTAADEITADDVAGEFMLHPDDDTLDWSGPPGRAATHRPATTAEAVELVAAGIGLLVVPQSLARLHHRRDLTYRPVTFAPESDIALTWPADETTDLMEQFIGIVRGRTVNSTRGRPPQAAAKSPEPGERKAVGKTAGKAAAGKSATAGRRSASSASRRGKPRRRS